jgi:hypothetical protein
MIGARDRGKPEIGTQECRRNLSDQFLDGVGVIAEALAELAITAMRGARPMGVMPISA